MGAIFALPVSGASAATFTVTNIADAGSGSLRQAIADANAGPGADTINFAPGVGGTIQLQSALPTLNAAVDIIGPGADELQVNRLAGGEYRIFTIDTAIAVTIEGLTISGGQVSASAPDGPSGGGVQNLSGTLTLREVHIAENSAEFGGGILNAGTMTLERSTVSGNTATSGPTGGAIEAIGSGTTTIRNSTISDNTATTGTSSGGVATSFGTPAVVVQNSTIADNTSPALAASNLDQNVGTVTVTSSIVGRAGDAAPNCAGTVGSGGFNIDPGTSCGFGAGTDQPSTNPLLGPLADNGGPTPTMAIPLNSPAIDQGKALAGATTDQRGFARTNDLTPTPANPVGGDGTDVGAFEFSTDLDSDGVPDADDNCPALANADQANTDGDTEGDACDADDDNDGDVDSADNCPALANADQANTDGDTEGDACDADDDNDGDADGADNCVTVVNASQADNDGDTEGDACDADDDNDGVPDAGDNCRTTAGADQTDTDTDGQGDLCDTDDDGDTVADGQDSCRLLASSAANGCPDIARSLTLSYKKATSKLKGKLAPAGPCSAGQKVKVFKIKPGPDRRVAKMTTKPSGKFSKQVELKSGKYKAKVKAKTIPEVGNCLPKSSKKLKLTEQDLR